MYLGNRGLKVIPHRRRRRRRRSKRRSVWFQKHLDFHCSIAMSHPCLTFLTARQAAAQRLPDMDVRLSQRLSSTTLPANPTTFDGVEHWPNFNQNCEDLLSRLDDSDASICPLPYGDTYTLPPAADDVSIRGAVTYLIFPFVNKLAELMGIRAGYQGGGSGRSLSWTDLVILDATKQFNLDDVSERTLGNGVGKGDWEFDLEEGEDLCTALEVPERRTALLPALQQLFGDMVMDETLVGFVTNYSKTLFFKRGGSAECKKLFVSPVVRNNDRPLLAFLYVLHVAWVERDVKSSLSRVKVPITQQDLRITLLPPSPDVGPSRKRRSSTLGIRLCIPDAPYQASPRLEELPVYSFGQLGLTSKCAGLGCFGNVVHGKIDGLEVVIKMFDTRRRRRKNSSAAEFFENEVNIYRRLQQEQGKFMPRLVCIGRLAHTYNLFLALSNEGCPINTSGCRITRGLAARVRIALNAIHGKGVIHGDLKCSNILIKNGEPKIIDFGLAYTEEDSVNSVTDFQDEKDLIADILDSVN